MVWAEDGKDSVHHGKVCVIEKIEEGKDHVILKVIRNM